MIHVLVIPAWYDVSNPLTGIFFHEYCNAMASQCKVTLLNFRYHSFSERFNKQAREDKIKIKKYNLLTLDFYNPLPGNLLGLSSFIQKIQFKKRSIDLIRKYISQEDKIDVIHLQSVCNNCTPLIGAALAEYFKVPYIVTEHYTNFLEVGDKFYQPFTTFSEVREMVQKASLKIGVSNFASGYCQKCFSTGFETVYNIIANEFAEMPIRLTDGRNGKFTFLCIGELMPRKGQMFLIRAFAKIAGEYPDVYLSFIGKGKDEKLMRELSVSLGISERIKIFNYHIPSAEFIEIIDSSAAIVSASESELFGLTIVEGFFRGKPALATRSGGPEELINGSNGLLSDFADVDGMAGNMKFIYYNYDKYNQEQIRADAMSKFSASAIVPLMVGKYKKVMGMDNNFLAGNNK